LTTTASTVRSAAATSSRPRQSCPIGQKKTASMPRWRKFAIRVSMTISQP